MPVVIGVRRFQKSVRELVVVIGKQGYGKTLWTKLFCQYRPRLLVYDPTSTYAVRFRPPEEIFEAVHSNRQRSYRLGVSNPLDVEFLAHLAFSSGKNVLVVEECSTVFRRGQVLPEWSQDIVFMGRHQDCTAVFVAQRSASIPIEIRSQANRIVTFQQHEDDDLDWMVGFFGREVSKRDIPSLPRLECLDYSDSEGVVRYNIEPQVQARLTRAG